MKTKFKSILAFLLSVFICFSVFPVSALAEDKTTVNHIYRTTTTKYITITKEYNMTNGDYNYDYGGSIDYGYLSRADAYCVPSDIKYFVIKNNFDDSFIDNTSDGNITITVKIAEFVNNIHHLNDIKINADNTCLFNYSGSYKKVTGKVTNGSITNSGFGEPLGDSYGYKTFTVNFENVKQGKYYFQIRFDVSSNCSNQNEAPPAYLLCNQSIIYTTESESSSNFNKLSNNLTNWFNNLFENLKSYFSSLFEWLSSIVTNIQNGFKNVGTWFTNLSNNIKGFFSDLSTNIKGFFSDLTSAVKTQFTNLTTKLTTFNNNIKSWFKNLGDNLSTWFTNLVNNIKDFLKKVGEWFTTLFEKLGNWFSDLFAKLKQWFENVGQWFKDLWNNITNKVTEIRTDLHNWWESLFTPDDGFFEAYKTSFDEFFKQHFGILYQVVDFFRSLFSKMVLMLDGGGSGVIEYGELSLPAKLFGKKLVILNSGTFSFDNLIDSDDSGQLVNISGMIYTVTSVIIYLVLLLRAKKIFEQIITNGEGVED